MKSFKLVLIFFAYTCFFLCVFNRSPLKPDQGHNTMTNSRRQSVEKKAAESCLSHNLLTILTIASVFGGVILGFILKGYKTE